MSNTVSSRKDQKVIRITKRRKKGGQGHHGGSWKVAYADFVTAMMAFFMVMWLLSMDDSMKESIEGYFSNPVGFKRGYSGGNIIISSGRSGGGQVSPNHRVFLRSAEESRFTKLASDITQRVNGLSELKLLGASIETVMTQSGLRIELIESATGQTFFPNASASMTDIGGQVLAIIGEELRSIESQLVLEGHTDSYSFSPDAAYTNWELSTDRAHSARRILEGRGISRQRIAEIKGYADRNLRKPDAPFDPSNRRISILLPFSGEKIDELRLQQLERILPTSPSET